MQKLLFLSKMLLAMALILFVQTMVAAQNPDNPFEPGTTVDRIFNWYTVLYSGVITVLTRLQAAFFPNAGALPRVAVRYALIALVIGGIFIVLGFTNAWGVVIGFVGSALAYDKVLEPLGFKTPSPIKEK